MMIAPYWLAILLLLSQKTQKEKEYIKVWKYCAIVNKVITRLKGKKNQTYSVNMIYNENKEDCIPKPLFYASLKHFESRNANTNFFFVFSAIF